MSLAIPMGKRPVEDDDDEVEPLLVSDLIDVNMGNWNEAKIRKYLYDLDANSILSVYDKDCAFKHDIRCCCCCLCWH
jgi:hypothetical protein